MGQYIVDLIAVAFAAFLIFRCARRGLFLTVLTFCKTLLAVLAANLFGSAIGSLLGKMFINNAVYNSIYGKFIAIYQNATDGFSSESILDAIPNFLRTDSLVQKLSGLEGSGEELVESLARTVSDSLAAVICTVIGSVVAFLLAMVALTIVYHVLKAIKKKFKLLGTVDGILGALLGAILAVLILMLFGSLVKLFFGTTEVYTASKVTKFFGDATLGDLFGWLNIGQWIDRLNG